MILLLLTSVINHLCQLTDPEGTPLGASIYLLQSVGPKELQQMVNKLLNNEEKLPYAFYISNHLIQLGDYLQKNKVSMEKVVTIVYQTQAATIAGHTEALLSVVFSPDGQQSASGSGDTTFRLWDLNTQTPLFTLRGHKVWVLCVAWSPHGKQLGYMHHGVDIARKLLQSWTNSWQGHHKKV